MASVRGLCPGVLQEEVRRGGRGWSCEQIQGSVMLAGGVWEHDMLRPSPSHFPPSHLEVGIIGP